MFFPDSRCWPTAPLYAFPEIVTRSRLSVPIAFAAAWRTGRGSTYPGWNCWVATVAVTASRIAIVNGNENVLATETSNEVTADQVGPIIEAASIIR